MGMERDVMAKVLVILLITDNPIPPFRTFAHRSDSHVQTWLFKSCQQVLCYSMNQVIQLHTGNEDRPIDHDISTGIANLCSDYS